MSFTFIPIKTRIVHPPKDEIWDILNALPPLQEKDILFITSKILAIHQGRCLSCEKNNKNDLIKQEASYYLSYEHPQGFHVNLTITDNTLIAAAGIDESNADNHYILWPKDTDALCQAIRTYLCKKNHIRHLGIISTDSHTSPLRYGVTGIATGIAGINPVTNCIGKTDLFGRTIQTTQINHADALSAMAVLLMGETTEQTPIILLRGYTNIEFRAESSSNTLKVPPEFDLYLPLLSQIMKAKK